MSVAPEAEATTCNNDTSSASKTGASQIFDLIKNHPEDSESNSHPRSNNTDLIDGTDHVSSNSAKDIDLMKVTLNQQGSEPAAKKHKKDSPRHARRQTVPSVTASSRQRNSSNQKKPRFTMFLQQNSIMISMS